MYCNVSTLNIITGFQSGAYMYEDLCWQLQDILGVIMPSVHHVLHTAQVLQHAHGHGNALTSSYTAKCPHAMHTGNGSFPMLSHTIARTFVSDLRDFP
jgi:hypothetical protein